MFCKQCGQQIDDNANFCANCGCQINGTNTASVLTNENDKPNTALGVLGFFLPLVGLIIFLVNNDKQPKKAKSAGKGALAGFITQVVIAVILAIVVAVLVPVFIVKNAPSAEEIYNTVESFEQMFDDIEDEIEHNVETVIIDDVEEGVSVEIGEFKIVEGEPYATTGLDITITNNSYETETYEISICAYDSYGEMFDSEFALAKNVAPNESVTVTVFTDVLTEDFEKYQKAEYGILNIEDYD